MTWTVARSRHVLADRWISVRADDCVTTAGVEVAPYYILEYPDFVHVLATDKSDRVILVRQYRHGLAGMSLELPGGMMDAADRDPAVTAARELKEETGYTGASFERIATLSTDPARFANRIHLVVARDVEAGEASPEPDEAIAVELVARQEALRLALTGGILNAQHVGLIAIALSAGAAAR